MSLESYSITALCVCVIIVILVFVGSVLANCYTQSDLPEEVKRLRDRNKLLEANNERLSRELKGWLKKAQE